MSIEIGPVTFPRVRMAHCLLHKCFMNKIEFHSFHSLSPDVPSAMFINLRCLCEKVRMFSALAPIGEGEKPKWTLHFRGSLITELNRKMYLCHSQSFYRIYPEQTTKRPWNALSNKRVFVSHHFAGRAVCASSNKTLVRSYFKYLLEARCSSGVSRRYKDGKKKIHRASPENANPIKSDKSRDLIWCTRTLYKLFDLLPITWLGEFHWELLNENLIVEQTHAIRMMRTDSVELNVL